MSKLKYTILFNIFIIFVFSSCGLNEYLINKYNYDRYLTVKTLNGAIKRVADQLQESATSDITKGTITITSFVDANLLERTSLVGRTISESLFYELFKRGFSVTDFRGKDSISVSSKGEFFITRSGARLKRRTPNTFVLAGTYSIVAGEIYISARIMDNKNGKIVSAARVLYTNEDCVIAYLCQMKEAKEARLKAEEDARIKLKLQIRKDDRREIIAIPLEEKPKEDKKPKPKSDLLPVEGDDLSVPDPASESKEAGKPKDANTKNNDKNSKASKAEEINLN